MDFIFFQMKEVFFVSFFLISINYFFDYFPPSFNLLK
jgi:hypothetical protein